jgi:hypothetical protein
MVLPAGMLVGGRTTGLVDPALFDPTTDCNIQTGNNTPLHIILHRAALLFTNYYYVCVCVVIGDTVCVLYELMMKFVQCIFPFLSLLLDVGVGIDGVGVGNVACPRPV